VILLISSYRQRCTKCKAVLFLLTGRFFSFSPPPQGRHFEPVEVIFGMAHRTLGKPKQVARQKIRLRNTPEHFPERSVDWSSNVNGLNFFRLKYLIAINH